MGADQPRGHTVGYHEPISGIVLGIWRHLEVVSDSLTLSIACASKKVSLARCFFKENKRVGVQLIKYFPKRHRRQATPRANLAVWAKA